jgi:hypothetical protein
MNEIATRDKLNRMGNEMVILCRTHFTERAHLFQNHRYSIAYTASNYVRFRELPRVTTVAE